MGMPSEGSEAMYRNPMSEVQRFFESRHAGHYRIVDLRSEAGAAYDPARFGGAVASFRFADHNPPPLALLTAACGDVDAWLAADERNVVAVHCKAGKGRTGVVIAAYLLRAGLAASAGEALRAFGDRRSADGKGVTIPSQIRYVHYFEQTLLAEARPAVYRLRHIRMHSVPTFDYGGGCDPFFDVRLGADGVQDGVVVFDWLKVRRCRLRHCHPP